MPNTTILYVEDEEFDALFMRRAIAKSGNGYVLQVVTDGQQAIQYLSGDAPYQNRGEHPLPALVLLDLNLPLISGFDVLRWIREQAALRSLPVVIFSSSARHEDRKNAELLGANAYIQKPGSALDFANVVTELRERWLDRKLC